MRLGLGLCTRSRRAACVRAGIMRACRYVVGMRRRYIVMKSLSDRLIVALCVVVGPCFERRCMLQTGPGSFKSRLRTFLFSEAFSSSSAH